MSSSNSAAGSTEAGGSHKANDPIAAGLRKLWDDVALEPVPEDFLSLLDRIDAGQPQPDAGSTKSDDAK